MTLFWLALFVIAVAVVGMGIHAYRDAYLDNEDDPDESKGGEEDMR